MFFVVSVSAMLKKLKINQSFDPNPLKENLNRFRVGQMNLKLGRFILKRSFLSIFDEILTSVEATRKRDFWEEDVHVSFKQ